jgi:hypothetical protein
VSRPADDDDDNGLGSRGGDHGQCADGTAPTLTFPGEAREQEWKGGRISGYFISNSWGRRGLQAVSVGGRESGRRDRNIFRSVLGCRDATGEIRHVALLSRSLR